MLTPSGCRVRQGRLRQALGAQGIDAAVISDPHEIYYFSGLLLPTTPFAPPALLWIDANETWIIAAAGFTAPAVDETLSYAGSEGSTVSPDQMRLLNAIAALRLSDVRARRLGWQADALPRLLGTTIDSAVHPVEWVAIDDLVNMMERRKDPDEIELIRRSVAVDLAAYRAASAAIQPGVNELDVLAAGQRAAMREAGEVVWHGGDYQSGKGGGWARDRQAEAGELYIIDAQTCYRGYWSDLSRAYIVGDTITDLQQSVFDHIQSIHDRVPELLKPGMDGTVLWQFVDAMIREHPALADTGLTHHAGHNIGLRAHELPDLNPERGGMFEVGNVVTVEPGAYVEGLRGGIRLENMYLITESGAENLSVYPMSLR
ncbi:MAG: aminopeptidase P family protein [Anaerolineae bacterium]|nr:aminopeptidase P family protein [Anaerolineae bacterium]